MAEKIDLSNIPYLAVGALVAVQEEIEKAAERLVDKGKSLTPEGRKKMASTKKGLVSKGDDFSTVVARTVQRALENTGIVTHSDLDGIDRRVTEIEKRVSTRKKPAAKKPAAKKPAAKKPAAKKPAAKKTAKKPAAKKTAKKPAAKKPAAPEPAAPPVEPIVDLIPPRNV
jgi:polyhydroxyalkanoate synthesis regulator phasin